MFYGSVENRQIVPAAQYLCVGEISRWLTLSQRTNLKESRSVMAQCGWLANFGTPKPDSRARSVSSVTFNAACCLIAHPGGVTYVRNADFFTEKKFPIRLIQLPVPRMGSLVVNQQNVNRVTVEFAGAVLHDFRKCFRYNLRRFIITAALAMCSARRCVPRSVQVMSLASRLCSIRSTTSTASW